MFLFYSTAFLNAQLIVFVNKKLETFLVFRYKEIILFLMSIPYKIDIDHMVQTQFIQIMAKTQHGERAKNIIEGLKHILSIILHAFIVFSEKNIKRD